MKVQLNARKDTKKGPDGTMKAGIRLDLLLDALIEMQAAGVPAGACINVQNDLNGFARSVVAPWDEER